MERHFSNKAEDNNIYTQFFRQIAKHEHLKAYSYDTVLYTNFQDWFPEILLRKSYLN